VLALVSCARPPPADPTKSLVQAADADSPALALWVSEVSSLLASKELGDNLRALAADYPVVFLRERTLGTVTDVAQILNLEQPGLRYVRTPVTLTGDGNDFVARAGWTGDFPDGSGVQTSSMTLGRGHFRRYTSANHVEKSCAINTLAHETTHTIAIHPTKIFYAIMDTGAGAPADTNAIVASYFVGSVAQCTWLQNQSRLPRDKAHLKTCVELFGVRNFNSLRCDRFTNEQPIEERPDLPGAAPPSWEAR
jgi:hypothetical protein